MDLDKIKFIERLHPKHAASILRDRQILTDHMESTRAVFANAP
jgi:hypothetical protein